MNYCGGLLKTCRTCGAPLWFCWIILGFPKVWQKRLLPLTLARDCIDLLPAKFKKD